MEQRLTIISLGVQDLEAATHFYETKFGWQKNDSSNENITFFTLNGILLGLYNRAALAEDAEVPEAGNGFRGVTIAHNARSEAEVDTIINDLREKGVNIIKEPSKVFWGGYSSYIADLDGHLWEIAYNPYLPLDEQGNAKQ